VHEERGGSDKVKFSLGKESAEGKTDRSKKEMG